MWDWISGIEAREWSALASCVTAVVAVVAGTVAWRQLALARRLRREQAAPYVVAYLDRSAVSEVLLDLVIKNFGSTVATNVRVQIDPPPMRSGGRRDAVYLPDVIPTLVPGQEYRTFWDSSISRHKSGLPDRHEAVLSFSDSQGKPGEGTPYRFYLDWGALWDRMYTTTYGMHDAAKALREMSKTIARWGESPSGGLKIYARDGDAKDRRMHEHREQLRAGRWWAESSEDAEPNADQTTEPEDESK